MMTKTEISVTTKNVISKSLFYELNQYFIDSLNYSGYLWAADSHKYHFMETFKEFLSIYVEKGKIEQPYMFSNRKNNTDFDNESGIYYLNVEYKQSGCLIKTFLVYQIKFEPMICGIDFIF